MRFEIEVREAQPGRNVLEGYLLQEGRAAAGGRAEVFAPGSIETPAEGVGIATEHLGPVEVRGHVVRNRDGRLRITAAANDAVRRAYADGKRYLSVEFTALRDRVTKGGVREIERAIVATAAMVREPEYAQATVEVREADDLERKARIWL